jgi:hypothetical protein
MDRRSHPRLCQHKPFPQRMENKRDYVAGREALKMKKAPIDGTWAKLSTKKLAARTGDNQGRNCVGANPF